MIIINNKMKDNLELEVWKPLNEFEGIYMISNYGRIKRIFKTKENILTGRLTSSTYVINLSKDLISYQRSLPKLVAEHFLPPNTNLELNLIRHKDNDKTNCHVDNLFWGKRDKKVKPVKEKKIKETVVKERDEFKSIKTYIKKQKPDHYVNNKELHRELTISKEQGKLTKAAEQMIIKIGKRLILKMYYADQDDHYDCLMAGYLAVFSNWHNFNPEFANAFAYISEIFKRGLAKGWNELHKTKDEDRPYDKPIRYLDINDGEGLYNIV